MSDLEHVRELMRQFTTDREWQRFHDPKSLLLALVGEVGELSALFQWVPSDLASSVARDEPFRTRVHEEMADVLLYLVRLADVLEVDLRTAVDRKMLLNAEKHPAPQASASSSLHNSPDSELTEDVRTALHRPPRPLSAAREALPNRPGIYAWWAEASTLPGLPGLKNECDSRWRLVYIGLAADLRRRITGNHLSRSHTSTLRRVLAGLLLDEQGYRTCWTDRVVLVDEDETRLTAWMHEHLRLTWAEVADPKTVEPGVIRAMRPPLNVNHAEAGPTLDRVKAARQAYRDSAGPRP